MKQWMIALIMILILSSVGICELRSPVEMESINHVKIWLNPESKSGDLAHALKFIKAKITFN